MGSVWWSRPNKVPCLNIWLDSPSLVHLLSTYNVIKKNCWLDTAACHMTLLRGWCFNFGNGCLCWKKRNLEKESSLHEFLRWENTKNEMKCGSRTGAFHLPPSTSPSTSQEEQAQGHMVSHVEAVVHLPTGSLVEEATQLQDFEVARAWHDHGHGQQDHGQAGLQVVETSLLQETREVWEVTLRMFFFLLNKI